MPWLRSFQLGMIALLAGLLLAFPIVAINHASPDVLRDAQFSADGKFLALSTNDGIGVFDLANGDRRLLPKSGRVAVSSDGRLMICGDLKTATLWDWRAGRIVHTWPGDCNDWIRIALSADGARAAIADTNSLRICEVKTLAELRSIPLETPPQCIAFAPDGRTIAVAASENRFDKQGRRNAFHEIRLFNVADGASRLLVTDSDTSFTAWVVFSADGSKLAQGANLVRVWDTATGDVLRRTVDQFRGGGAFSQDGHWLAVGGGTTLTVLNADRGKRILHTTTFLQPIKAVASSANHVRVVAGTKLHEVDPATLEVTDTPTSLNVRGIGWLVALIVSFVLWIVAWSFLSFTASQRTSPERRVAERFLWLTVATTASFSFAFWTTVLFIESMPAFRAVAPMVLVGSWILPAGIVLLSGIRHTRGAIGICATIFCIVALAVQWIFVVMLFMDGLRAI